MRAACANQLKRGDFGMPPSVARSQLPNDPAHATMEPSQDLVRPRFSGMCCTNGTLMPFRHCSNLMILKDNFLKAILVAHPSQQPSDQLYASERLPMTNRSWNRRDQSDFPRKVFTF